MDYIRCICLLYYSQASIKRFCFFSVDDALAILPMDAQILFHQCVVECMQYLNAVPWTPVQKFPIVSLDIVPIDKYFSDGVIC